MFELRVLGGVGEKGRVSFEVTLDGKRTILDYGVKRKIIGDPGEVYPHAPSGPVDVLFLSHFHLDHVGAVPLLDFEKLICSEPTFELLKVHIESWMKIANNLLMDEEKYEKFMGSKLSAEKSMNGSSMETGMSGHTVGSLWALLKNCSLLYTGDIALDSPLYRFDPLPEAKFLIVDAAYGTRKIPKRDELLNIVAAKDKRIILPLPGVGRSQEILMKLIENDLIPVFVDKKILDGFDFFLKDCREWTRWDLPELNFEIPENLPPGIYLTTDGMITSGTSLKLFNMLRGDKNTLFVMTGHQEEGTIGWKLLREGEVAIQQIWKIHPDTEDLLEILSMVKPDVVIPFHSDRKDLDELKSFFERNGVRVLTPEFGESVYMEEC